MSLSRNVFATSFHMSARGFLERRSFVTDLVVNDSSGEKCDAYPPADEDKGTTKASTDNVRSSSTEITFTVDKKQCDLMVMVQKSFSSS